MSTNEYKENKDINDLENETTDINEVSESKQIIELKDQLLRNQAELENFKKRINEERIQERKYGNLNLIRSIIDPIDNFNKALNIKTDEKVLKNFLIGFKMINNQLMTSLKNEGIKKIESSLDKTFDPNFHQSIEFDYIESKEENIILEELSVGYMYKDRVLKPTLVKINKKQEEENNE